MADSYTPPQDALPEKAIREQQLEIQQVRKSGGIQHGRDELVMIVNQARQVVYLSPGLESFARESDMIEGKRPGDLLGCTHASAGGCGFTEHCEFCGAATAILATQRHEAPHDRECVIETGDKDHSATYNFKVRTFPIQVNSESFVMLLLDDIGAEKHRSALERIFFHDILNTVTGLKSYLDVLRRQIESEPNRELVSKVSDITSQLVDEIQSQKLFASAENGTLSAARQYISSRELIEAVVGQYRGHDVAAGKEIEIAGFNEAVSFVSDETILRRVLGNMLKNALEASNSGEVVTINCTRAGDEAVFGVHNTSEVPRQVRLQIFGRFFSTKGPGRGLGTYSIKLLTERYLGGRVWFTSEARAGTDFYVAVPLGKPTVSR